MSDRDSEVSDENVKGKEPESRSMVLTRSHLYILNSGNIEGRCEGEMTSVLVLLNKYLGNRTSLASLL